MVFSFLCIVLAKIVLANTVVAADANTVPAAYQRVALQYHIPADLFYAIALTESGYEKQGTYNPWPWTLNVGGEPYRYQKSVQARQELLNAWGQGKSVDVGLMQINTRWHGHRVQHIADFLNPYINLSKAAEILIEQRRRSQDWWEAVGRYHAPGNDTASLKRAERYRQRVQHFYQQHRRRSE